ncbi:MULTISPECIES: SulP family inorganic anion transporter [unclassified Achromobacter]|uniref:SulP family inorganic anion transporter n=1 Tax=unclassified Achromobacter TaxID=2626865 RepID=UPI000B51E3C6|nr:MULTISPECIES: SulP family inorganic anion transporter [unclassified Achromobacter]OWT75541.1 sodium-independent anion transporter [Achromobacter sp. HZ28]OWT76202.1 sodium-independent anion transporter [Achromobacter sp. HZ34]
MDHDSPGRAGKQSSIAPSWLRQYQAAWARQDLLAGLTTATVVIPKALAYATVAGLPVQAGVYTAFLPMILYAMLGSSRTLSVSTTTTLAILTATALERAAPDGDAVALAAAAATLTILVGVVLVLASVLRLGFLANFISEPVLIGFKAGIAIVIVIDQVPKLLGIHFPKGAFVANVQAIIQGFPATSLPTVAVAALTAGVLLVLTRFVPRAPAPLLVVAGAIAASALLGLGGYGVESIGYVPTGLPSLTLPAFALVTQLWPIALGMALMSFTETIAAGRAFVRDAEPSPAANRELIATGLANIGGGLFGGMPAGGGASQTAVNFRAGARTQVAELVTAVVVLAVMTLLAPLIGLMPQATLAAVVVVYSVGLFEPAEFRAVLRIRRTELAWALVALAGVVLLGTLQGILVAIVVSLASLAYQVSNPPVHMLRRKRGTTVFRPASSSNPDDESFPGLLILRPEGRIFFVNVGNLGQKMRDLIDAAQPRIVVLDMSNVFDIEYTALRMMDDAEKRLASSRVTLWMTGLSPAVLAVVRRSPLGATLGTTRLFHNLDQAIAHYQEKRGPDAAPTAPDLPTS